MSIGKRWNPKTPHDPRDTRSGLIGVPRWYRHTHGSWPVRRIENHKLFLHLRSGEWDDHMPESRFRQTKYYWWH